MKLRNKKTGKWAIAEIVDDRICLWFEDGTKLVQRFDTLAELTEEWEDYKEPKEYWHIVADGEVFCEPSDDRCEFDNKCREIGNYFETREEAEQAVEKLKAWKRLKDKGLRFYKKWDSKSPEGPFYYVNIYAKIDPVPDSPDFMKDLDLLFGGEEPVHRESEETRSTEKEEE